MLDFNCNQHLVRSASCMSEYDCLRIAYCLPQISGQSNLLIQRYAWNSPGWLSQQFLPCLLHIHSQESVRNSNSQRYHILAKKHGSIDHCFFLLEVALVWALIQLFSIGCLVYSWLERLLLPVIRVTPLKHCLFRLIANLTDLLNTINLTLDLEDHCCSGMKSHLSLSFSFLLQLHYPTKGL